MHVILAVDDVPAAVSFYERAFGWPRNERLDYDNDVELHPAEGDTVGFFERDGFDRLVGAESVGVPEGGVAPSYLYVRVDDLGKAAQRIEAAGGKQLNPPSVRSWGDVATWYADPNGNVVAIAGPTK